MPLDLDAVTNHVAAARAAVDEAARRSGRDRGSVDVLAAVKYLPAEDLDVLHAAGIRRVGENKADALIAKQAVAGQLFTWDFIGHLQSRKARDIVGRVTLVHSVQSDSSALQLDKRAEAPQDVLVEVNVAADPAKYGVLPGDLDEFLDRLAVLEHLRVRGLMTMPPFTNDAEASRPAFAELRELATRCGERFAGTHTFDVLSMGTSQDYAVAVEEGATIIRLGGSLYGELPRS